MCRECNKAKCKAWYRENQARKKQLSLAYKAEHGASPAIPLKEKRQREVVKKQEEIANEPDDWQMIRFSRSEWLFCLQEAHAVGLNPNDYVRILVRDARDRKQRRAFLQDETES